MTRGWPSTDLATLAASREIDVTPATPDGMLTHCATIWVVRVGDDLYVRSYRGPSGGWYRAALRTHHGEVHAGRIEREVTFEEAPGVDAAAVDAAYRTKYGRSPYVEAMVSPAAASTTMRLVPR